jgi:hypothetical protein
MQSCGFGAIPAWHGARFPTTVLTSDLGFVPPFCPNAACRYHEPSPRWRFGGDGTFWRDAKPHVIRRFRCLECGRRFSTQTFDLSYYSKRPELLAPLLKGLVAGSGLRQLGRSLGAHPTTLQRQASRLGRHALLFQETSRPRTAPSEPLALDGLVTFEYSQYLPCEINNVVGTQSSFYYGFLDAELRRSGAMRPEQKKRRAELEARYGKPDPRATERCVETLLRMLLPTGASAEVHSDQHATYPRVLRRLPNRITHQTVSSRRCRTRGNLLFVVDHLDLLVRHSGANHKRETIAFSKRRQGALERMAVTQVWWNFVKRTVERRPSSPTPAMNLGLTKRPLSVEDLMHRRLFPSKVILPEPLKRYYDRLVQTRAIPNGTRHELKYAC